MALRPVMYKCSCIHLTSQVCVRIAPPCPTSKGQLTSRTFCQSPEQPSLYVACSCTPCTRMTAHPSTYRDEVNRLAGWCSEHNLLLNTSKTKEMVIDFRKQKGEPAPLSINGDCVQRVSSFKFLGIHLAEDLSWTTNTSAVVKKARQRLHFLRILRSNHLEEKLLVAFYRSTIESVLMYCIMAWFSNCPAEGH